jgi:hypothetical protein
MYGAGVSRHDVLGGSIPVPESARALVHELDGYSK